MGRRSIFTIAIPALNRRDVDPVSVFHAHLLSYESPDAMASLVSLTRTRWEKHSHVNYIQYKADNVKVKSLLKKYNIQYELHHCVMAGTLADCTVNGKNVLTTVAG